MILDQGIETLVVPLMNHPTLTVSVPALRTVGNIVTGDDHQTQVSYHKYVTNK